VGQDQHDRGVPAKPVVEVSLLTGVLEAGVCLVWKPQPAGLALDQQHEVEHLAGAGIDQIDVAVDAVIHTARMKQETHLGDAFVDQRDAGLTDQGLGGDLLSSGHDS
jgi:hypothetical protein